MSQGSGGYGPPGNGYAPPPGYPTANNGYPLGAPYGYGAPPGPPDAPPGDGSWSPTEALAFAFNAVKSDYMGVALPLVVGVAIIGTSAGTVGFVMGFIREVLTRVLADSGVAVAVVGVTFNVVIQLVSMAIQSLVAGGMIDFALRVVRGGRPPIETVFKGIRFFVPMLGGQLLMSLLVVGGMLLFIVPGIILALGLSQYTYLIVDKQMGAVEALQASWKLTSGHKVNLLGFGMLATVVLLGGLLACCLGLLVGSVPILAIAMASIYVRISGETPTLAQR